MRCPVLARVDSGRKLQGQEQANISVRYVLQPDLGPSVMGQRVCAATMRSKVLAIQSTDPTYKIARFNSSLLKVKLPGQDQPAKSLIQTETRHAYIHLAHTSLPKLLQ